MEPRLSALSATSPGRAERAASSPATRPHPAAFARLLASSLQHARRFPAIGQPAAAGWGEAGSSESVNPLGMLSQFGMGGAARTGFADGGLPPSLEGSGGSGTLGTGNPQAMARLRALLSQRYPTGPTPDAPLGNQSIDPLIRQAAQRYRLDPALIAGVIQTESGFNPQAVSPAGAKGLMQLMDGTARGLGVTDPYNPVENVHGGAKLLRQLLDRYQEDVSLALAAYNAGPGAVDRFGGIPPYQETQTYVPRVLAATARFRAGLTDGVHRREEPWT